MNKTLFYLFILFFISTEEATHTADFLDHMDKLFNAFNSRTASSVAPMRHAFSEKSGHKEFLTESLSWLKTIKCNGKQFSLL